MEEFSQKARCDLSDLRILPGTIRTTDEHTDKTVVNIYKAARRWVRVDGHFC